LNLVHVHNIEKTGHFVTGYILIFSFQLTMDNITQKGYPYVCHSISSNTYS